VQLERRWPRHHLECRDNYDDEHDDDHHDDHHDDHDDDHDASRAGRRDVDPSSARGCFAAR
jgi:hypothetical protein